MTVEPKRGAQAVGTGLGGLEAWFVTGSQDLYGDRARLVLEVIPVIPALIRGSILGGD